MSIYGALGLNESQAIEANLADDLDADGAFLGKYAVTDPSDTALAAEYDNDPLVFDPEEDGPEGAPIANESEYCLWSAAREFYKLPHKIIVFDKARNANCHGHTMHPGKLAWVDGSNVEQAVRDNTLVGNYCLFYRGDQLAHSGILEGGKLVHRLIHVGVLVSETGGSPCGYTWRFDLPGDRDALLDIIQERDEREAAKAALIEQAEQVRETVDAIDQFLARALEALETYAQEHDTTVDALCGAHAGLGDGATLRDEANVAVNALYDDPPDVTYIPLVPTYVQRYAAFRDVVATIEGSEDILACLADLDD